MKTTRIYINPFDLRIIGRNNGIEVTIFGAAVNGTKNRKYQIIIQFDFWWIKNFIRGFKEALDDKLKSLREVRNLMN